MLEVDGAHSVDVSSALRFAGARQAAAAQRRNLVLPTHADELLAKRHDIPSVSLLVEEQGPARRTPTKANRAFIEIFVTSCHWYMLVRVKCVSDAYSG